jgi:hypothetical protein
MSTPSVSVTVIFVDHSSSPVRTSRAAISSMPLAAKTLPYPTETPLGPTCGNP